MDFLFADCTIYCSYLDFNSRCTAIGSLATWPNSVKIGTIVAVGEAPPLPLALCARCFDPSVHLSALEIFLGVVLRPARPPPYPCQVSPTAGRRNADRLQFRNKGESANLLNQVLSITNSKSLPLTNCARPSMTS